MVTVYCWIAQFYLCEVDNSKFKIKKQWETIGFMMIFCLELMGASLQVTYEGIERVLVKEGQKRLSLMTVGS